MPVGHERIPAIRTSVGLMAAKARMSGPSRSPARRLFDQCCCERKEKAFRLSRTSAARDDDVVPITHHGLNRFVLVAMQLSVRRKQPLGDEVGKLSYQLIRVDALQHLRGGGGKQAVAADVWGNRLNQRRPVQPAILVEHAAPLVDEWLVAQVKRAIEVAQIGLAQAVKYGDGNA